MLFLPMLSIAAILLILGLIGTLFATKAIKLFEFFYGRHIHICINRELNNVSFSNRLTQELAISSFTVGVGLQSL
jgi:hypothetical protein